MAIDREGKQVRKVIEFSILFFVKLGIIINLWSLYRLGYNKYGYNKLGYVKGLELNTDN